MTYIVPSGTLNSTIPYYTFLLTLYSNYMALSPVVSEPFNVEKFHDLEIGVKGHSRSLKVVPFNRLGMDSY